MASALFGAGGSSRSKNLVEFKAGKMTLKGKMVHPDKRKGLVYVYQSDDSLMHFCWKDRTSGVVEDDLMIFPDDIETRKVAQCTTGRVFLMKFKSSNKKFFFWMQEPESDKDEKLWRKLNDYLNNPPAPGSSSSSASIGDRGGVSSAAAGLASAFGGADFAGLGGSDLQSLLGSMSEQQLQMFLGGLMPVSPSSNRSGSSSLSSNQTSRVQSTTPGSRAEPSSSTSNNPVSTTSATTQNVSATPAAAPTASKPSAGDAEAKSIKEEPGSPASQKIQFSDLQSILGNLASGSERSELDLSEIVTLDVMAPILANKNIQEKLIQYLPDSDILPKNEHELRTTLTTPQFKKAMSSFGSALQSGQLGPLMKQFDLPESVTLAAAQGNLEAFAKAMEAYSKSKKSSGNEDEDSQMDPDRTVASSSSVLFLPVFGRGWGRDRVGLQATGRSSSCMARARSRAVNQSPCNHSSAIKSRTHPEDKTGTQEILEIPPQPLLTGVIEHRRKEDSVSHVSASARGSAIQCRRPARCSQNQQNPTAGGPSGHLCSSWGCRYGRRLIGGAERRDEGEEISQALALALSCCCCCCCIPAKVAEKAQQLWQRCCELGAVALLALFVLFLVRDAAYNRFGTSNGRFISFVDTCLSVMSYREGLPAADDVDSPPRRLFSLGSFKYCIRVTIGSFVMKFAAGFVVSLLLNQTPVFLKGPRHALSLLLGLALLWLCPGDSAYVLMRRSHAVRLVLLTGGGLYKLRKAIYAVESIAASNGSFVTALLVVALAVDGNTVTRRVLLWAERQLHDATPRSGSTPPVAKDEVNFAARFCHDGSRGAWRVLTATLIPLSLVTGMLWWAILSTRAGELSEEFSLELRIGLLLFFIVRVGALQELSAIHLASMAPPPEPAKPHPALEEPLGVDVTVSEPVLPRASRALVNGRSPLRKKVA